MLSSHILPELAGVCDLIGILEKGRMLAFGSVEEVSQKVKENLKLTLILDSDSAVAKAVCESFTEVQQLHGTANELHFTFNGLRSKVPELVQQLCAAEVRIIEIKEEQADLEQVFLSVTHQSA
jgi:ABC-2 type transport system ATP-binding protein